MKCLMSNYMYVSVSIFYNIHCAEYVANATNNVS